MEQIKINRINELARKAKVQTLSDSEKAEQDALRKEYIADYRKSLRSQLNNIVLVDDNGKKTKLKKKS